MLTTGSGFGSSVLAATNSSGFASSDFWSRVWPALPICDPDIFHRSGFDLFGMNHFAFVGGLDHFDRLGVVFFRLDRFGLHASNRARSVREPT